MERALLVTRAPSEALLAERRLLGLDRFDEIWDGEHHMMTPGPAGPHGYIEGQIQVLLNDLAPKAGLTPLVQGNIGTPHDCRVPDATCMRGSIDRTYFDTAALAVEVVSPGDESWKKFDFYAAHDVDEVLIADPETSELHWFRLVDGSYQPVRHSTVLDVAVADVHRSIDWLPDQH